MTTGDGCGPTHCVWAFRRSVWSRVALESGYVLCCARWSGLVGVLASPGGLLGLSSFGELRMRVCPPAGGSGRVVAVIGMGAEGTLGQAWWLRAGAE